MQNAIEIRGLKTSFPRFELGPLDLTVPPGAMYGLVGPNGAGKTTVLDLIFGLGPRDAGDIRVLGLDNRKDEVAVKRIAAYVSPHNSYSSWGQVGRAIRFVSGFYPEWDQDHCDDLLRRWEITEHDEIATLSLGKVMKLGVILALARRPKILIMDEPMMALDAISKRELFAELLALMSDGEHTILVSSHNLADLERFADHIAMISEGTLLLEGATDQLLENYRQVTCTLAGELPAGACRVYRDGDKVRALTESSGGFVQALEDCGATELTVRPITLEELFVALVD